MTNEPIINAKFKKFRDSFGLSSISDGDAFERFVTHAILTVHQPDAFSSDSELLETVCVGGMADTGIDGLAIKVNGLLVIDIDDIKQIIEQFKKITIEFIFIQSKYKPNFEASELNTFIAGVRNFLSNEPSLPMNVKISNFIQIKDYLLSDDVIFYWDCNPRVRMYYVAMGKWRNHQHHTALVEQAKRDVLALRTYEGLDMHFIDSDSLRGVLDSIENNFNAMLDTIVTMELTPVEGVDNSCIALCNAEEFSKLLLTQEGVIRKSLFDDNVRDFQGENDVNNEILETIAKSPQKFILLNNGITIVCDSFISNNRKLKISNPQIVNGCQTSHMIYMAVQQGLAIDKVPLNIKIIATKDQEISNEIVRGTNTQNIVQEAAFEGTKRFHRDLEAFFNDFNSGLADRIFYERRLKQYNHNPTIRQVQKINLKVLTQYFVGMFLDAPHHSHRHESFLLKEYANVIYLESQSKLPYFAASYTFYVLEQLFRERQFYPHLRPYKAHLLMMFRESIVGRVPSLNSEKVIDAYINTLLDFLRDPRGTVYRFEEIAGLFDGCIQIWTGKMKRNLYGMKDVPEFTELLLKESSSKYQVRSRSLQDNVFVFQGKVIRTMVDRFGMYCGFISRTPDNIFFHSNQNKELDFIGLTGKTVNYKIGKTPGHALPVAIEVSLLS